MQAQELGACTFRPRTIKLPAFMIRSTAEWTNNPVQLAQLPARTIRAKSFATVVSSGYKLEKTGPPEWQSVWNGL